MNTELLTFKAHQKKKFFLVFVLFSTSLQISKHFQIKMNLHEEKTCIQSCFLENVSIFSELLKTKTNISRS